MTTAVSTTLASTTVSTTTPPTTDAGVDVVIDAGGASVPIDPRLFGTNVPAWLGPETLSAQWFRSALADAGVTTLRIPGGSWSNSYPWDACELATADCWASGAATPSDFAELLATTGLDAIWTVSINTTAESAAALVAFFNGAMDDLRPIGVDRNGTDWGTVAQWAGVRAAGGHPAPIGIARWEIGNEVWGGRPDTGGGECVSFGWEEVWTCDGTAYMEGDGEHDGFLAFRAAMRAVDPAIEVGVVGVSRPGDWSDWGNEVLAYPDSIDFYVVHEYGFSSSPSMSDAARRPGQMWPAIVAEAAPGLAPRQLAITEYNLVSFEAGDTERSMTKAANAFFLADTLGRLAVAGVGAANHWNMVNGTTESGTDYGLVALEPQARFPAFAAFEAWAWAGAELLVEPSPDAVEGITLYATRIGSGQLAIVVLNPGDARDIDWEVVGVDATSTVTRVSFAAADLDAGVMVRSPDAHLGTVATAGSLPLPAYSINVVLVGAAGG